MENFISYAMFERKGTEMLNDTAGLDLKLLQSKRVALSGQVYTSLANRLEKTVLTA